MAKNTAQMTNYEFGIAMETVLKPILEEALEDTLTKTADRYCDKDFLGEKWIVELKCRRAVDTMGRPVSSKTFMNWFMSDSKIQMAKREQKVKGDLAREVVFFYYFERDQTLWSIVYDEEEFSHFKVDWTPLKDKDGKVVKHQKNYQIPCTSWDLLKDFTVERKSIVSPQNEIVG